MRLTSASVGLYGCVLASVAGAASAQLDTELFVSGLSRPVAMVQAPNADVFYVVEQGGEIHEIVGGVLNTTPLLDLPVRTGNEQGFLGMALHPDFADNGLFYLNWTPSDNPSRTRISEFQIGGPAVALTERVVLEYNQPFSNHNGGWMDFGPDGYLYIASGDGGSGNDPQNNSSRLNTLLGKMLRIDVDARDAGEYGIPSDNPFVGDSAALPEIWAYGLRNPFRNSFDMATGDLWMGDVGQNAREEINFQPAGSTGGEHYGWRCFEGTRQNFSASDASCQSEPPQGFVDPVVEYSHGSRCSITGGYVYRGCEVPELEGRYIFGDFCTNEVFATDASNPGAFDVVDDLGGFSLGSFAQDNEGELYALLLNGQILKFVSAGGAPAQCDCPADVNGDGQLSGADFNAWLSAFNDGDPLADQNFDGILNGADFNSWLGNFSDGCG